MANGTIPWNNLDLTSSYDVDYSGDNITGADNFTSHYDGQAQVLKVITTVGASLSILGILLTLLTYIGYRKFHVKRTHIIMVNLCACLLVYYISYLLSNSHRQHTTTAGGKTQHGLCVAGAFLCHFSVLCVWFWIAAYWALLLVMFKQPVGGHINHFFFKSALPAYGIPFLAAFICIVIAYTNNDIHSVVHPYFSDRCFITNNYLYGGLITPFLAVLVPILIVCIYVWYGVISTRNSDREQRSYRRVKGNLTKLSIITILTAIVILSILITDANQEIKDSNLVAVIVFTVGSTALGLLLMFLFCIHQEEIRHHWVAVVTGKSRSLHHRTMSRGKADGLGIRGSSRKHSNSMNNQPGLLIEAAEENERKSSTIRIVPKDDTDMSTLGLIQIPGTPSPRRDLSKPKNSASQNGDSAKLKVIIDEGAGLKTANKSKHERSSMLVKMSDSNKSRSESVSSSGSKKGKYSSNKRQKSVDNVGGKSRKKEVKRRSFSTSSIKHETKQLSIPKRQSVVSTDSTRMTNFD